MTETSFDIELLSACHEYIRNHKLGQLMQKNLVKVGPPKFTEEEEKFAEELSVSISKSTKEKILVSSNSPVELINKNLHEGILENYGLGMIRHGSADTADISYQTPLAQLQTASRPLGVPGHSWQTTAASGMSIGHKGMLCAAKVIALTALDLITNPELLKEAYDEWLEATKNNEYKCGVPKGAIPNLKQVNVR